MGYTDKQIEDLESTLKNVKCDIILNGSPIDLSKLVNVNKPIIKVTYDIEALGTPSIESVLDEFVSKFMK
jgi:predicted GTPase